MKITGTVVDADGGVVRVLVNRATEFYPTNGTEVAIEVLCRVCNCPESTEWHYPYYVEAGANRSHGVHPFVWQSDPKPWNEKIIPGPRLDANIPDQWAGVMIDPTEAEILGYDSNVSFGWCRECGEPVFSVRYELYPQPSAIKRYPVTQPCGHTAGFTQHEPHEYIKP